MSKNPPTGNIAYICECGKKWVFPKTVAASTQLAQHPCTCGRVVMVQNGLIYATQGRKK